MSRILDYVEAHYTEPIRLRDLAEAEQLSTTYVSHFFSEQLGVSFQIYLNNLRLEQAVRLMAASDASLSEIALTSGFSDPRYLGQMIRRRMGCSAGEFRQSGLKRLERTDSGRELLERYLPPAEACAAIEQFVRSWGSGQRQMPQ